MHLTLYSILLYTSVLRDQGSTLPSVQCRGSLPYMPLLVYVSLGHIVNPVAAYLYGHPFVSLGDWLLDPRGYKNPWRLKSLIENGVIFQVCVYNHL